MQLHKKQFFYGWVIVATSALLLAVGLGMFHSTNSVFVKPICDSLGFARGEFTLYRTIITLVGAFVMPFYGKCIQKIGVKKVLLTGALMLSIVAFGYSFSTKLWHFYTIAVLNGLFVNGIGFMSVGVLVNSWFNGKKGIASGLAFSGSGLGGAIMVPIIGRVIELTSWQWAYRLMAAIGIVILMTAIVLLVKNNPSDMGLKPFAEDSGKYNGKLTPMHDLSFREAAHTGKFWMLLIAFFFISFFAAATNTHSAPYLSDLGYSAAFVSLVISLFMVFLTIGKVILGSVYDRFGTLAGNIFIAIFCLAFPVFALLSYLPAIPWVYAACIGMASCGTSVPLSLLVSRFFGQEDYPTIFGFYSMMASLASSISVPGMGAIYDMTGSYRLAWLIFLFTSVIIAVSLVGAELIHKRQQTNAETVMKKDNINLISEER